LFRALHRGDGVCIYTRKLAIDTGSLHRLTFFHIFLHSAHIFHPRFTGRWQVRNPRRRAKGR